MNGRGGADTARRAALRAAVVAALSVVPIAAARSPASANEYERGCVVHPGILVGEDTWSQGCPHDLSVGCAPVCDELQVLVKPLVAYAFDTAHYALDKACETEPHVCE